MAARLSATAAATLGIVPGSYHRCGFGVLSGRPSSFCTTMTWRPESGTAFSMLSMNVS